MSKNLETIILLLRNHQSANCSLFAPFLEQATDTVSLLDMLFRTLCPCWTCYFGHCVLVGHAFSDTVSLLDMLFRTLCPCQTCYFGHCVLVRHAISDHTEGSNVAILRLQKNDSIQVEDDADGSVSAIISGYLLFWDITTKFII